MDYIHNIAHIHFNIEITNKENNEKTLLAEKHSMRYLFYPEVELMASLTGFQVVKFVKWMEEVEPTENSWYVLYALKKI